MLKSKPHSPHTSALFQRQILPSLLSNGHQSFHTSERDNGKRYHNVKKVITRKKLELAEQQAKYLALEVEDRPKGCIFHQNPDIEIDYKNVRLLSQFVSPHTGRMYGRKITGLCTEKQNELAEAIKRSRRLGYMPVTMKYFDFHGDPKLF